MFPQAIDYDKLAQATLKGLLGNGQAASFKAVSSTPTTIYGHGPGGLFASMGLSRPLFSAMLLPRLGLQSRLAVRPTVETNPLFGIITGMTATTGTEPTGVCDDPPVAGTTKLCTHSFVFGRQSRMSRVFDLDRAGKVINRGEFTDFMIYGNPMAGSGDNPNQPTIPGMTPGSLAQNEIAKALWELGVSWSRDFAAEIYTGNPTNNTAGGGRKYAYGLDVLINTGYRDAETGVACPAADSVVYSFGSQDIKTNPAGIVRLISYTYRNLKFIARKTNLEPVKWVIAMPFGMFYELTEAWPISYATYRESGIVGTGSTQFVDSSYIEKLRDEMRGDMYNYTGQFLLIDGQRVEVVIDDAIAETQSGASWTADMYFVPLTVLGGQPVTYQEYFDYDTPNGAIEMARLFAPGDSYYTSDGGRFLWHKKPPTNFCVQLLAKTETRLLLLTPFLAARITDVKYTPVEHERSWDPTSDYFYDGGKTATDSFAPSYYSPTA